MNKKLFVLIALLFITRPAWAQQIERVFDARGNLLNPRPTVYEMVNARGERSVRSYIPAGMKYEKVKEYEDGETIVVQLRVLPPD